MTTEQATKTVQEALRRIVPDADFADLSPDENFRDALELDSLDFLSFVETLTEQTGIRIDEDDYGRLSTLADAVGFLVERS